MKSPEVPTSSVTQVPSRSVTGRLIGAALVLAAIAGVVIVILVPRQDDPPAPPEIVPVNVEVQVVALLPRLADEYELTAVVEPDAIVKVAAEVAGRVERYGARTRDLAWRGRDIPSGTPLVEGEPVLAGEPLVYLNRDLIQARFDQASAQFEYDQRELRRLLDLFERGSTSQTELDDARTHRDMSQAALEEVKRQLDRTTIVAPIDGILNRLPLEVGEYAAVGDDVAELVNMDPVKVIVYVPERDVRFLQLGQTAAIGLPGNSSGQVGHVTYVDELADEQTRTTRIEITVPNPDHAFRCGQIVDARLTRRLLENVVLIPLGSVIPLEEGRVVYVATADNTAESRPVTLGIIRGREVQVTAGLNAGDRLIVNGQRYVGPGQRIRVIAGESAPTAGDGLVERAAGEVRP